MSEQSQVGQPGKENEGSPKSEAAPNQKAPENPPVTPPPPVLTTATSPSPAPNNEGETNQQKEGFFEAFLERHKKKIEIFAVFGGLVLVGITASQYKEMVRATNATKDAVEVSRGQLVEMQQTRKLDERAWVSPYYSDNNMALVSNTVVLRIQFKNTGKTPAFVTGIWDSQSDTTNSIHQTDPQPPSVSMFLAPNATFVAPTAPISFDVVKNIANNKPWYVYGTIWYNDIFGDSHWTQFCLTLIGPDGNVQAGPCHNACGDIEVSQKH